MFTDPLTIMGAMSIPFLVSNFATFIGFLLATFFSMKYTAQFYEGRARPMSWGLILGGLMFFCVSEFGQFLLPYRLDPSFAEALLILVSQDLGVIMIAAGAYLLYKEVGS